MEAVDYRQLCAAQVPEQYKGSERLLGLVGCVLDQCQELETAFFELLQMLDPADATGPALDFIGALAGVARRPAETDERYRRRIVLELKIADLPSTESVRRLITLEYGLEIVGLYLAAPAGLYVVFDGTDTADLKAIEGRITSGVSLAQGTFLRAESEAGVNCWIVSEDTGKPFVVDSLPATGLIVDGDGDNIVDDSGDNLAYLE